MIIELPSPLNISC